MNTWRLQVNHPGGVEEILDLDQRARVTIGDSSINDICLNTVDLPSSLPVVQKGRKGLRLILTEEVESSLRGEAQKKKPWKNSLYRGHTYDVAGPVEWAIGSTQFKVFQQEKIALGKFETEKDPLARRYLLKSGLFSLGLHLFIFSILVTTSFVMSWLRGPEEIVQMERISIAKVDELFKPPTPPAEALKIEEEVAPTPRDEVIEQAAEAKERTAPKVAEAKKNLAKSSAKALAQATRKSEAPARKSVESMGILAVASAATTSSDRSLVVDAPRMIKDSDVASDVGSGLNLMGSGIRAGRQNVQVAQLNGISAEGYATGSLAQQVSAAKGPSIQLVRKEIEVRGGLDPAVIQQIIEERLAEVRYCYENALLSKPDLAGKISTSWTIQSDGTVQNLDSSSEDLRSSTLQSCMKERIMRWKFPAPKGGGVVHVKYPFVFSALGR